MRRRVELGLFFGTGARVGRNLHQVRKIAGRRGDGHREGEEQRCAKHLIIMSVWWGRARGKGGKVDNLKFKRIDLKAWLTFSNYGAGRGERNAAPTCSTPNRLSQ